MRQVLRFLEHGLVGVDHVEEASEALQMLHHEVHPVSELVVFDVEVLQLVQQLNPTSKLISSLKNFCFRGRLLFT